MAILISDIELADLQTQVKSLGDDTTISAKDDPVRAAESVCRGIAVRQDLIDRLPPCHSMARKPLGYEECAECLACFDKLSCIVSLHRVDRARPPVRYAGGESEAVTQDASKARVTVLEPVSEEVRLQMLGRDNLKDMADEMGIPILTRHKKSEIVSSIIDAKKPVRVEKSLVVADDRKTWSKSKGKYSAGDLLETPKRAYKGEVLEVCEDDEGVFFRSPSLPGEPTFRTLRNAANAVVEHYDSNLGVKPPKYVNGNKFWRLKNE